MIFGEIDYINLLPFNIYLKKHGKRVIRKKSYPSKINRLFKKRAIDSAIISTIMSKNCRCRCYDMGIVANKEVSSVIVKPGSFKEDTHSNTSNVLAKILKVEGEVIIGDKALKLYLQNKDIYIDLAEKWRQRYKLPFVFARFCANSSFESSFALYKGFISKRYKIPQYILDNYAKKREISKKDIKKYLELISYKIGYKEKKSIKLFLKLSNRV